MLKKISQISLSLACMILILHAIIPHHNHPDKPICINSLNHNDCHNHTHCCDFGQHDNHNHDYDKSHCIIDDYFAPKDNNEFQISLDSECLFTHFSLFFDSFSSDLILEDEGIDFRRPELTLIYKNPLAISNIGLRAPPRLMHNS